MAAGGARRVGGWRLAAGLAGLCFGGLVQAHSDSHPVAGAETPAAVKAKQVRSPPVDQPASQPGTRDARTYFTDTELLTQDGRTVRFYSDVLADRVVLINVVYTNCEDACPLITRKLIEVRQRLEEKVGKEVWFVSISTDPERDSPQALKKFAQAQCADEQRWFFLTGAKANVDQVLKRLGQMGPSAEEHSTLLIAGDVAGKRWSKIRPDAPPAAIAERLKVLAAKP
ncbi:MAG TPA: SCO family protein [Rhodocyclaceae bacterium]|nr:SCO family protein [Rhodocyclaceae bacterium]